MRCKYDAYTIGLGAPKRENVEKQLRFKGFLMGAEEQEHSSDIKKVDGRLLKRSKQRTDESLDMR